jgi:hypothetical protein
VLIPLELCDVRPNQRSPGKGTDDQAAAMIKITAAFPAVRQERVYDGMNKMHGANSQELLNSWGVTLAPKMVFLRSFFYI